MKFAKRGTFLALVLAVLLLCLPLTARAETSDTGSAGDAVTWTLDSTGTLTISGSGEMTSAPWITDYRTVIKKVVIEEGVTNVYGGAFENCTSLAEVSIPGSVTRIGSSAFDDCAALETVNLPEGVKEIGSWAFYGCGITDLTIPTTVEILEWYSIKTTVENLHISDLAHWISLDIYSSQITYHNVYLNGELVTDLVVPDSITSIPVSAFNDWDTLETVTIPESVTSIGQSAFYGCDNLREINLPNSLTSITSNVFGYCPSLTSLTLPASVLVVNSNAFYSSEWNYTSPLAEVRFMGNAPLIAADAFTGVTATVYYSANNASWTEDIFQDYGGTITWVADDTIPGSTAGSEVVTVDSGNCGDKASWTLDSAGTVTISGSGEMTSNPWITDYRTVIKKVVIEEGVTNVYGGAFENCTSLAEVSIPGSVTRIGSSAFDDCAALETVNLPEGVKEIGSWAFYGCGITDLTIPTTVEILEWYSIKTTVENLHISDLAHWISLDIYSSQITYHNVYLNGELVTDLVVPDSITSIPVSAFNDWDTLETVTIPESVTSIGQSAFYGCDNLREINLPNSLTSITSNVFGYCPSLTSLTLPASVLVVNSNAFYSSEWNYTSPLAEVRFMGNAPLIAADAFTGVTATVYYSANNASWTEDYFQNYGGTITWLPDSEIPDAGGVPEVYIIASGTCGGNVYWQLDSTGKMLIGTNPSLARSASYDMDDYASPEETPWAAYSEQIKQVVVESTVTSVGENAFADCGNLVEVTIGEGVQDVGASAFSGCESLMQVSFQGSAPALGENSFAEVNATISYPAGDESWSEEIFDGTGGTVELQPVETEEHVHSYAEEITEPSCTEDGYTTYTCAECGESYQDNFVPAVGHSWVDGYCENCGEADPDWVEPTEPEWTEPEEPTVPETEPPTEPTVPETEPPETTEPECAHIYDADEWVYDGDYHWHECECGQVFEHASHNFVDALTMVTPPTCTEEGYTTYCCEDCGFCYTDNRTEPAHSWDEGEVLQEATETVLGIMRYTCTACGEEKTEVIPVKEPEPTEPEPTEPEEEAEIYRLAGGNRFDTAFKVADQMKVELGVEKFDAIIVASGSNFADALGGSYLSAVKNAPILLSYPGTYDLLAKNYIIANLNPGGTVYILGGTSAVPASMEDGLGGFKVKRLAGDDRFGTNLAILQEAGVAGKDILVCTGISFADSLSASASELPILLVWKNLSEAQKGFLSNLNGNKLYVIGGTGAVSKSMENQVATYGEVTRIGGGNRFETSVLIAEEFFDSPESAVLAYGLNFPDGLCGGGLAAALGAPLILTMDKFEAEAADYVQAKNIANGYVLGSSGLVSDKAVRTIFALEADAEISQK